MDIQLREHGINGVVDPIQSLMLRSMFWGPHYLDDSAWLEHIPFSYWLVEALEPGSIVEVGAPEPVAYFSMCHAVVRLNLDTRCEAIYPARAETGAPEDDRRMESLQEWNNVQFHAISRILHMPIDGYADNTPDGSVDLLHIDLHREEKWADFPLDRLMAKLSPRGVCLVHGTRTYPRANVINEAVAGLSKRYPSFEFTHGDGLTLLAVGTATPGLVRALCAMSARPRARQAVRDVFSRLGRACLDMRMAMKFKQANQQLMAAAVQGRQPPGGADANAAALARATREIARLTDMLLNRPASPAPATAPAMLAGQGSAPDIRTDEQRPSGTAERERAAHEELERLRKLVRSYETEAKRAQEHRRRHEQELTKLTQLVLEKDRLIEQRASRPSTPEPKPPSAMKRLTRWMRFGARRKPTKLDRDIQLLQESDLFDASWYAAQYLDGASPPAKAARHFLTEGAQKGYHPSRKFDISYYLERNPDVVRSDINPLIHYLKFGVRENRKARGLPPPQMAIHES
jgi:hypothetical protein